MYWLGEVGASRAPCTYVRRVLARGGAYVNIDRRVSGRAARVRACHGRSCAHGSGVLETSVRAGGGAAGEHASHIAACLLGVALTCSYRPVTQLLRAST